MGLYWELNLCFTFGVMDQSTLINGIAWYLVFLFSTTAHEASHALVALKLGDDTAYRGGQVSLDPVPHIRREPFGMVLVPIFTFITSHWMVGWASAPYNALWARQYPKRAAWMAAAGPAANLALVLIAAAVIHIGLAAGYFKLSDSISFLHLVDAGDQGSGRAISLLVSLLFSLNLLLFTFNLLPFPPLDGSGVLTLFLSDSAADKYRELIRSPVFTMVGLVVAWKLFAIVYNPIENFGISLLFPGLYHPR